MFTKEWTLLVLLIASIFLNYVDRSNLSIAAPLLETELRLSPAHIGSLLSSFFWTYSLLQLFGIAGWLADRFSVVHVFTVGFVLWSVATIATGLVSGFQNIFLCRLVLGAGESLAYPCYSRLFATFIPQDHRGRANAFLDAASKLGPAVGTALGGVLLARIGWRMFFIALGAASLLWIIPWLHYAPYFKQANSEKHRSLRSAAALLRTRSAWGTFLGHFCGNYFWFFLLTWLPSYLVRERGLTIGRMAGVVSVALGSVAGSTLVAGWLSDRFIARGVSTTRVRKSVVVTGLAGSSVILPVAFTPTLRSLLFCFFAPALLLAPIRQIIGRSLKHWPAPLWRGAGQAFKMGSEISLELLRPGLRASLLRLAALPSSRLSSPLSSSWRVHSFGVYLWAAWNKFLGMMDWGTRVEKLFWTSYNPRADKDRSSDNRDRLQLRNPFERKCLCRALILERQEELQRRLR